MLRSSPLSMRKRTLGQEWMLLLCDEWWTWKVLLIPKFGEDEKKNNTYAAGSKKMGNICLLSNKVEGYVYLNSAFLF